MGTRCRKNMMILILTRELSVRLWTKYVHEVPGKYNDFLISTWVVHAVVIEIWAWDDVQIWKWAETRNFDDYEMRCHMVTFTWKELYSKDFTWKELYLKDFIWKNYIRKIFIWKNYIRKIFIWKNYIRKIFIWKDYILKISIRKTCR